MNGMKTIYNRSFKNVLCVSFIKGLMINVRQTLQKNIITSQ